MSTIPGILFTSGGAELLDVIIPLWTKLRQHHSKISPHFGGEIAAITVADRKSRWLKYTTDGKLHVDIARLDGLESPVGYCVTVVDQQGEAEVDSLFVEEAHRRHGIGDALMRRALVWLDEQGVKSRFVEVAAGNEETFRFYARYGFFPRRTILRQVGSTNLK
jgi:diamine N-acetyltransferase